MSSTEPKLTQRQRRFVEAFMGEAAGNATAAARIAGYKGSDRTLAAQGSENLTKPNVASAIKIRVEGDPIAATRAERQQFWTRVMNGEELESFVTQTGEVVERPPRMADRLKASELLGKTQADFVERHELTTAGSLAIGAIDLRSLSSDELAARLAIGKAAIAARVEQQTLLALPAPDK